MIEVVMCIVCRDKQILLVHRAKKEGSLMWAFPGGTVEDGETVYQTAIRELKEETNLDSEVVKLIGDRIHPYTKKHMAYIALTPTSFELKIGDDDLDDLKWVNISELENYFGSPTYEKVQEYLNSIS